LAAQRSEASTLSIRIAVPIVRLQVPMPPPMALRSILSTRRSCLRAKQELLRELRRALGRAQRAL
jgi:hypothetical protein